MSEETAIRHAKNQKIALGKDIIYRTVSAIRDDKDFCLRWGYASLGGRSPVLWDSDRHAWTPFEPPTRGCRAYKVVLHGKKVHIYYTPDADEARWKKNAMEAYAEKSMRCGFHEVTCYDLPKQRVSIDGQNILPREVSRIRKYKGRVVGTIRHESINLYRVAYDKPDRVWKVFRKVSKG